MYTFKNQSRALREIVALNKLYFLLIAIFMMLQLPLALAGVSVNTPLAELQTLAEQGNANAQAELGYRYHQGEGVAQDYAEARKWYQRAAKLGHRDAQYNLAVLHAFGEGVPQDHQQAFHWYQRAAEQNHPQAQYSLGLSYLHGEGVAQNPKHAAEWFQKAAERGYGRAQVFLASLYHTGNGVEKNYERAAHWYRKAAVRGNAVAQYNLGSLYSSGEGVPQDTTEAIKWLRLSAAQEYPLAQDELKVIEKGVASPRQPADTDAPDTAKAHPKPGFFARFFGTTATPDDSGVVYATPQQIDDAEKQITKTTPDDSGIVYATSQQIDAAAPATEPGFFARLFGTTATPDDSGIVYATPQQIDDAEKQTAKAPPDDSGIVYATPQPIADAAPATEIKAKTTAPGFFAQLFGTTTTPDDSGVVYATPQQIDDAEKQAAKTLTGEMVGIAELQDTQQPGFFAQFLDEHTIADDSGIVYATPQPIADAAPATETQAKTTAPGFFAQLFGTTATPDDSGVVYATPQQIDDAEKQAAKTPPAVADSDSIPAPDSATDAPEPAIKSYTVDDQDRRATVTPLEDESVLIDQANDFAGLQPYAVAGHAEAQYRLGDWYHHGKNVKRNQVQAFLWYRRAAEQDHVDAQYALANLYLTGDGVRQNDLLARQWFEKAAAQGHADARQALQNLPPAAAEATPKPAYDPEKNKRVEVLQTPSEDAEDEEESGGFLSRLFGGEQTAESPETDDNGQPEEEDKVEVAISEPVEDAGEPQRGLLDSLFGDDEAPAEADAPDTAADLYQQGIAHEVGQGVEKSDARAFALFQQAAEQHYAPAQYKLALAYSFAKGTAKDPAAAVEWYQKSAAQGYAAAQRTLAILYMNGDGVPLDKVRALAWYEILADGGKVIDVHRRNTLKATLNDTEIEQANTLKHTLLTSSVTE